MVKIACIGIGSHSGFVMSPSAEELRGQGYDITVCAGDSVTLDSEIDKLRDFLDEVAQCDFIFIMAHGDVSFFRHWSNLRKVMEKYKVSAIVTGVDESISLQYKDLFLQSPEDYATVYKLETIGGDENHRSALKWALRTLDQIGRAHV